MEWFYINQKIITKYRDLNELAFNKYKEVFSNINCNAFDIITIIAPLISYNLQILKFCKTKSSKGFSKYTLLFLYIAHILRIFFWLGTHFRKPLLLQSIIIVIFQIILIHLCIKYQEDISDNSQICISERKGTNEKELDLENKSNINLIKNYIYEYLTKTFKFSYFKSFFSPKFFWKWIDEKEYYQFMLLIVLLIYLPFFFLKKYILFFHIIGLLSAFFEAVICIPQIILNFRIKVTKNLSFLMILSWLCGELFRMFYNIKYGSPLELIVGTIIKVILDLILLLQLICFRNNNFQEKNKINDNKKQIEEINKLMKSIDELNVPSK